MSADNWPIESIPNDDTLYMRVHKNMINPGSTNERPRPNVFRDQCGSMSTDWAEYSRPEDTKNRGRVPDENAVVLMNVGAVRDISLQVQHAPIQPRGSGIPNRAHTEVIGDKSPEVRVRLSRASCWCSGHGPDSVGMII